MSDEGGPGGEVPALLATAREVIGGEIFLVDAGEQLNAGPADRRHLH